ncbi:MAG: hypothetical protein Q7J47_02315 [Azoarcus sp.]|nr:hypothetical protein [Azoarcus sp.]
MELFGGAERRLPVGAVLVMGLLFTIEVNGGGKVRNTCAIAMEGLDYSPRMLLMYAVSLYSIRVIWLFDLHFAGASEDQCKISLAAFAVDAGAARLQLCCATSIALA